MEEKSFKIRPYARLLTMLGEQLIKNEQIALAELIKNSYDADADWVKISFENFGDNMTIDSSSQIIIEDNGCGMSLETIEKSWMNPATPNKKTEDGKELRTSQKKRIIQGEKGIGRFAVLKLGRKVKIITRLENSKEEYVVDYDFSAYDDEFLSKNGEKKELFIDDISINVRTRIPLQIVDRFVKVNRKEYRNVNNRGTRIEISNLKGEWSNKKIEEVNNESQKLVSIFDKIINRDYSSDFEIGFDVNGQRAIISDKTIDDLTSLIENSAVLRITDGFYSQEQKMFEFKLNNNPYKLYLNDPLILGIKFFKDYFVESKDLFSNDVLRKTSCGDFGFNFFVFDLNADKESKYSLNKDEKALIKDHRIYLYRDKVRVAPYGDPSDDWIEIDKKRGVGRTGDYLSNDQVVGFVDISKKNNPKLKDKTNREGLIEEGTAMKDFVGLLHTFLLYIRQHPYKQYKQRIEQEKEQKNSKLRIVESKFKNLQEVISDNPKAMYAYQEVVKSYQIEKDFMQKRLEITEDLAGVGLSVETTSHDMMLMLSKGVDAVDSLIKDIEAKSISEEETQSELLKIRGIFSFVDTQMRDIQLLFKSSKQRRREIRVSDILDKVVTIYKRALNRENVALDIQKTGSPVIAKCTDAVLLQLLINLFDNSIYWLSVVNMQDKKISVKLDGENNQLIFSDNGPGIHPDDEPYIFEAFYSGKEDGRGLGLYIANQLLRRMGYSISLAELKSEKILSGANFVVNFIISEEND